jgi:hypothetical protein
MANQIRIKRRAATGSAGAPSSLKNAELAFNEADNVLYYGYGDDGNGNATSIIGIGGDGNVVSLSGTQTITGNKTYSGTSDFTGPLKIDSVTVTATAAELNKLDGATITTTELNYLAGVSSNIQAQLDANDGDITDIRAAIGIADGATDLGNFAGSTIADGATAKEALEDLEAAVESNDADITELDANQSDLIALSGVNENAQDLGDFDGVTISANRNIKQALQELETSVESKGSSTSLTALTTAVGDLNSLSGVAQNETDLGEFTGSIIADDRTIKEALQDLETELEDGAGTLTADSGTADFANGTVTVSGGVGLSTAASGETLTVNLDNTAVTSGSYGNVNKSLTVSFDAQGRATFATSQNIDIAHTQVNDFDAGVRTNRLDQMTQPSASVGMNGQRMTGLADPVGDQDAATKAYVDATAVGLDVKASARVATTEDITLSGVQTIDGVGVLAGERVLVKNQTDASENGIYDVVSGGSWTRSEDAVQDELTSGAFVFIEEGTVNANSGFVVSTPNPITIGSDDIEFSQFSGAGQITAGAGMTKSGNTLDVNTASSDRVVINANNIDLATHGTAGTYNGLTIDAYGRASSFTSPTTLAGYSITDAQPLSATLTAVAALSFNANEMVYSVSSTELGTTSLTSYARSLLDDSNATSARATLGLGTMAIQNKNNVDITGGVINGCALDGGTF